MTFDPFTWHNGNVVRDTPLSAENLNGLEQRIAEGFDGTSGGSGSLPRVVVGGTLGATPTLAVTSTDSEVWLTGTLNANTTLTITGMPKAQVARLFLVQDTTGGRTLTVEYV